MRTINSAKVMRQENRTGSLVAGKDADFIIVDRDVLALGKAGDYAKLAGAQVLDTVLEGQEVYRMKGYDGEKY